MTCLVTLFDRKLQIFKNLQKLTIFGFFNELLSTQNVKTELAPLAILNETFSVTFKYVLRRRSLNSINQFTNTWQSYNSIVLNLHSLLHTLKKWKSLPFNFITACNFDFWHKFCWVRSNILESHLAKIMGTWTKLKIELVFEEQRIFLRNKISFIFLGVFRTLKLK